MWSGGPSGWHPGPGAAPDPAGEGQPLVSVVIPTCRRDGPLRRCLEAVLAQDFPPGQFEVIVVDDARSKRTPRTVAEVAARHPAVRLRLLPGPGRGPAAARNCGWRAAGGALIAFIDDDSYPADRHWLAAGVRALARPDVALVAGVTRVPLPSRPTDHQRNVQGLERAPFLTCNAFCRRRWLEQVGGFDEAFTVPFREDSDLQFRIEAAGGRLVRCPQARVVHPAPPGRFAGSLQRQRYSMFNALIYKKHPRRYRELQRHRPLAYYATVVSAAAGVAALLARRRQAAGLAALAWLALTVRLFLRRLHGTSRHPLHLLDLALTSALIPPLSVYWRLRGAVRFRVWFW